MSALGMKGIVGIIAVIGLAIVYFGPGVGTESPKKEASARANPLTADQPLKPVRAMNLALGNMVFLAQDLGFSAASVKGGAVDPSKIAARIEGQLQGVREIYRQEATKNSSLVGAVIVQLHITPAGEVAQIKELSSRLNDIEFKKAILNETSKWSFAEIVNESIVVTCPLLFVHEGMDITTLVRWEKSLSNFEDKSPRLAGSGLSAPQAKPTAANIPAVNVASDTSPEKIKPINPAKPETKEFQIKYATLLRKDPNFMAPSLTSLTIGTKVTLLGKQGDWLEVRANQTGPNGFIRKEFVTPVQVVRK